MLKSYLKTAFRFLLKNKTFSFINIFGLTLGTLCCLYIVLYVTDQYSYDQQHARVQDIYRVYNHFRSKAQGREGDAATTVSQVSVLIKRDFPEVEQFTRVVPFLQVSEHLLRHDKKTLYEKDAVYVDSTFFDVFSYHFLQGNPSTALAGPYSIVLLKPTADKLFGKEDPLGKILTIENVYDKKEYTVRGVVDESLGKSHLKANIFITLNSGGLGKYMMNAKSWVSNGYVASYIKLRPDANPALLEKKLPALVEKYGGQELRKGGFETQLRLQPVRAIHTTTGMDGYQRTEPVSSTFLNILLGIAILILVIACINFMNLSTARASKRAKEVGVRKVIGAGRKDLVKQFLGESFLLSFIGVLLALPLLIAALPLLNQITGSDIQLSFFADYRIWLLLAILIILTGLVAGSYPAFYLSAFRAIKVIKGNFTSHISAVGIRRSLVVFQFVLSIVLITGIIIINRQLNYIKTKDLGFKKEQRVILNFHTNDAIAGVPALLNDLRKLAGVREVSNSSTFIGSPILFSNGFFLQDQKEADAKNTDYLISDEHFIKANGIQLISGRDFRPADSAKVLINETYAKMLGLDPMKAIGVHVNDNQSRVEEIIGVIKDFNYLSLHKELRGFLIWKYKAVVNDWPTITISANTGNYAALLGRIETAWHKDITGVPFTYTFQDEQVKKQYESDISLSRIINSFTLMAILISCLGLFGLAAFSAEQRSKEISIRKVLGATVPGLAQLLSKDFLKLVIVAFVIAAPIGWWAMNQWLKAFPYRIAISWWMFALAGAVAIFIALVTVSFQAIRAAVANPIKSLRSE